VQDLATKKHDLSADTLKVMLTNSAPSATNAIKADITEISAGNGYTAGGNAATESSCSQSSGTLKLVCTSPTTWTASGGTIGPFRYAVIYNDTQATPAKPLIGFWDYGSAVTLNIGETFTVTLDGTNGVLQIA
jgi:hypothetical protein